MGEVLPLPSIGDVFVDVRGDDRTLRVSYHADGGVVVVSLWAGAACRGSFRMGTDDVGRLLSVLADVRDSLDAGGPVPTAAEEPGAAEAPDAPRPEGAAERVRLPAVPPLRIA